MLLEKVGHVTVYKKCDPPCGPCSSGARWFSCAKIQERFVADYRCYPEYIGDWEERCDGRDEDKPSMSDTPHHEALAHLWKEHPGCDFVYLDPAEHDRERYRAATKACYERL